MVLLMGSLDDSNVLVVETTLVFFREMMDMPAVQQSIHSNLARIIRLVLVFLSPHSQVDHSRRSATMRVCCVRRRWRPAPSHSRRSNST